jgi:DNA-binding NarL/FixJ family response regulator
VSSLPEKHSSLPGSLDGSSPNSPAGSNLHPRPATELDGLTEREREVPTLVSRGLSNAEIAEHAHISLPTVKTHISHLLTKLAARDRAHLVIAAYETGLIRPQ